MDIVNDTPEILPDLGGGAVAVQLEELTGTLDGTIVGRAITKVIHVDGEDEDPSLVGLIIERQIDYGNGYHSVFCGGGAIEIGIGPGGTIGVSE